MNIPDRISSASLVFRKPDVGCQRDGNRFVGVHARHLITLVWRWIGESAVFALGVDGGGLDCWYEVELEESIATCRCLMPLV
jgi:hypothetical protein